MITLRHTTLGRNPLYEWSARPRDLYLTTHNTNNRQTSMSQAGFEPTIPASKRPQTHVLSRGIIGIGGWYLALIFLSLVVIISLERPLVTLRTTRMFLPWATALVDQGLLIIEDSWSHSHTPHSVGLLWTNDKLDAETSTWQHTTLTRNKHRPGGILTHNPNKRAAA